MIDLGFWKKFAKQYENEADNIGRPAFVLAPMADVTDCAFRQVIAANGKPDVTWTEFVSADGLVRATPEGKAKLMRDLLYNVCDESGTIADERPIVAQLFSSRPEYMKQAAKLVAELGFDGIDINMGCPDKSIEKQGCGSAMIKNPKLAQEIITAAKEGAALGCAALGKAGKEGSIPVSVKTRIGYSKDELETWLPALLEAEPALITIHARTRKEMSKVPARWEHVKRAVEIRDKFFMKKRSNKIADKIAGGERVEAGASADEAEPKTLIFGNGDILSIEDGYKKAIESGADGVMLGRAIFGNPWLFKNISKFDEEMSNKEISFNEETVPEFLKQYEPSTEEKLRTMVAHTKLFEQKLGDIKNFAIMKKHYKAYVNGFDGAKELRLELMEKAETAKDVEEIVEQFIAKVAKI